MLNPMKRCTSILLTLLISWPVFAQDAQQWTITADEWSRPRNGDRLVHMQPLVKGVQAWVAPGQNVLLIRYPGGEEGGLWAQELRDWLVSLGVPSQRMRLVPGQSRDDVITIEIKNEKELIP